MELVLNEFTKTVHKRKPKTSGLHTECGASRALDHDKLQVLSVEQDAADYTATKCGRCFTGAGGY